MELNAIKRLGVVGDRCKRGVLGATDDMEVRRDGRKLVAMGHPDLRAELVNALALRMR